MCGTAHGTAARMAAFTSKHWTNRRPAHVLFAAKHCNICSPSSHVCDNDTMPTVAVANALGLVVGCCVLALIASAVQGECSAEPQMQSARSLSVFKAANAYRPTPLQVAQSYND